MLADLVIVGEDERDAERVRGDSGVGQRLIVAAREKRVAVLLVFVDVDAGLFAGGAKDRAEVGEIEPGERRGIKLRPLAVVGAPQVFEVDHGDGLFERKGGMAGVVARPLQALLLAEPGDKDYAALRPLFQTRQSRSQFDHRDRSAAVVVRAIVDAVAFASLPHADVIVMRGDDHIAVLQRRIGAAQQSDDVAQLDDSFLRTSIRPVRLLFNVDAYRGELITPRSHLLLTVVNGQFDKIVLDRPDAPFGSLKIAFGAGVARRLQPGAAELSGDVLSRDLKPARRSVPAFEQVGRYEREMAAQ